MTPVGRWAAAGALVVGIATAATWNAATSTGSAAAVVPVEGSALFRAKGCATCHDGPGTRAPLGGGYPSLTAAATWAGSRRAGLSAADYLTESIAAPDVYTSPAFGGGVGPGISMPQLALTAEEIDAIVDYLLTSPPHGS